MTPILFKVEVTPHTLPERDVCKLFISDCIMGEQFQQLMIGEPLNETSLSRMSTIIDNHLRDMLGIGEMKRKCVVSDINLHYYGELDQFNVLDPTPAIITLTVTLFSPF